LKRIANSLTISFLFISHWQQWDFFVLGFIVVTLLPHSIELMYPNLYYALKDIFGVDIRGFRIVNSFGFFVGISFFIAAVVLMRELKRREQNGLLNFVKEVQEKVGNPSFNVFDWIMNGLLGFLIGFKFGGAFGDVDIQDTQKYIISKEGSLGAGVFFGSLFLIMKGFEFFRENKIKPGIITRKIWPHQLIGDIVMLAIVFGFLGAKLFHNFENLDQFMSDPWGSLISFSGLTFYGGLICAALAIYVWSRKKKIPFVHVADSAAPALMLSYSTGRMGCQVAGDGDWGIVNTAYKLDPSTGKSLLANANEYAQTFTDHADYYVRQFGSIDKVQHASFAGPSWLPNWMFGYSFPHNVLHEGRPLNDCAGDFCNALPMPVFPTPFYEIIMAFVLFVFLWVIRKRITTPGKIFGIYLIVNGLERFLIEKIRVNTTYSIAGFHPTQAEIISTLLVVVGTILVLRKKKKPAIANVKMA
jgi:phosphatidylglycerol---prolipoprotein diacylglyceryl transferase